MYRPKLKSVGLHVYVDELDAVSNSSALVVVVVIFVVIVVVAVVEVLAVVVLHCRYEHARPTRSRRSADLTTSTTNDLVAVAVDGQQQYVDVVHTILQFLSDRSAAE